MKKPIKNEVAKGSNKVEKATNKVKEVKAISVPKVSKVILAKQLKSKNFKKEEASSFDRLLEASRLTHLDAMSLSKAFKNYLASAKKVLTPKQMSVLKFNDIKTHIAQSKYKNLPLFSVHQVALICNEIIKANDLNTKRAVKVARQNKAIAKK